MTWRGRTGGHACRGTSVRDLGYCETDCTILRIARHYFSSFANPTCQGWVAGIAIAIDEFDQARGPQVAVAVLSVVQAMRCTRQSGFHFNAPECEVCSVHVTPHEQGLMSTVRAFARGNADAAHHHATLLCEGNDVTAFLAATRTLTELVFGAGDEMNALKTQAPTAMTAKNA